MSRIGRLPIPVPSSVEVKIDGPDVIITGPKGSHTHRIPRAIVLARSDDGTLKVSRENEDRETRSLHGLTRSLLNNIVVGVTDGFTRKLEIVGTGYRVVARGADLEFALGFSHPVSVKAPEGVTFAVESATRFSVAGSDKQQVGEVAANIRKIRPPEPYKGKGVRYAGEIIRRKVGKAGK